MRKKQRTMLFCGVVVGAGIGIYLYLRARKKKKEEATASPATSPSLAAANVKKVLQGKWRAASGALV